ncbi:hypothetical protein GGG16DRAFT_104232 [Schizophyllum commune]
MSADHAHDVEHSTPTHDLELKWTRATSENHTKRRDGPPQLPSLLLGLLSRCILDLKDRYSRDAPADGDVMDGYPLAYASRHPESPPKKRERAADVDDIMPDLVSHLAHLSPVQRATRPDAITPDPKAHPPSNSHLSRALVVIVGKGVVIGS